MPQDDKSQPSDDYTIPSRKRRLEPVAHFTNDPAPAQPLPKFAPWALQQYFDGEVDLIKDLAGRYPQIPLMSLINMREVGTKTRRAVASIATQDHAAGLVIEIDVPSRAVQFMFIHSSMLTLRFVPAKLTPRDRAQFIEPLRRESGEAAFLWDQTRWENDFLIAGAVKSFTHLFAFSPFHVEAAARLTPEVTRKLLDWLEGYWKQP
jgi:hypothetical protein